MNTAAAPTIIQTLDGAFYRVTETGSADLAHVWNGIRVKWHFGEWVDRKNARVELVRKVGARIFTRSQPDCPACKTDGYQYTCEDCWQPA